MAAERKRSVLLVGSMPFEDERAAMQKALDIVGDNLLMGLPDGEIGEKSERYPRGNRAAWVQAIIDLCERDSRAWDVIERGRRNEAGFPVDYESGPVLAPKHSPKEMLGYLNFRWVDYFDASFPIFEQLRESSKLSRLRFQVGLPTGIGITFGMMSPPNALRYAGTFGRRMALEANQILAKAGAQNLVFQLEVPGNLAMAYKLPKGLARLAVQGIIDLVLGVAPEAPFGVHLCFGDLNNEALIKADSLAKAVHFTNVLLERWPATHELAYVHFPLAEAAEPPSTDPSHYAPLKDLRLPPHVRLVAGFVHDRLSLQEHEELLQIVESAAGSPVDVAASCGLGRREPDVAEKMMRTSAALASP